MPTGADRDHSVSPLLRRRKAHLYGCALAIARARKTRSRLLLFTVLSLGGMAAGLAAQFNGNMQVFVVIVVLQGAVWAMAATAITRVGEQRPGLGANPGHGGLVAHGCDAERY